MNLHFLRNVFWNKMFYINKKIYGQFDLQISKIWNFWQICFSVNNFFSNMGFYQGKQIDLQNMGGNIYISCLGIKYFLVNWFILCLREAVGGTPSGCYRPICTSAIFLLFPVFPKILKRKMNIEYSRNILSHPIWGIKAQQHQVIIGQYHASINQLGRFDFLFLLNFWKISRSYKEFAASIKRLVCGGNLLWLTFHISHFIFNLPYLKSIMRIMEIYFN